MFLLGDSELGLVVGLTLETGLLSELTLLLDLALAGLDSGLALGLTFLHHGLVLGFLSLALSAELSLPGLNLFLTLGLSDLSLGLSFEEGILALLLSLFKSGLLSLALILEELLDPEALVGRGLLGGFTGLDLLGGDVL